jgi:tRNA pseudouridine55 synthase
MPLLLPFSKSLQRFDTGSRRAEMARRRPSTPGIDGVLLVDKPSGPTSHDVVAKVRRLAGQPRIGHGGTLDPFATGLLVLLLGRATRLAELHLGGRKRYQATFSFGGQTTTDDLDGERIGERGVLATKAAVTALLPRFRGRLEQVPPSHSAKRTDGVRAYERARAGELVELAPRAIDVREFALTAWDDSQPDEPLMEAALDVSSGTYIRAIARDLGRSVGSGAHLVALRRTAAGSFDVARAHSMESVAKAALEGHFAELLLPLDAGLEEMASGTGHLDALSLVRDGAPIPLSLLDEAAGAVTEGEQFRLLIDGVIVALVRRTAAGAQPERVFVNHGVAGTDS